MISSKLRQALVVAGESVLITLITVFAVVPFSCKITEQGIQIISGDYVSPVLTDFTVTGKDSLKLEFSEKVTVTGYVVAKAEDTTETYGAVPCTVSVDDSGCVVNVVLEQQMEIGQAYEFYSQVKDSAGNSLTLAVPFSGYNSRVPALMITEVQSEGVSQNKAEAEAGTYRSEFVEVLVLKDGNLAGLELCSGYDGETKKYIFPAIEVHTGEIFIVHLRNRGNGCISELGDELDLAYSSYTKEDVRDLWTDQEGTALGNTTDIIIIKNQADGKLLDAVMYRASKTQSWTKTMIDYSQLVSTSGIYESGAIENAFVTDGLTASKTLQRTDAAAILQNVLAGQEVTFPVSSGAHVWQVSTEVSPGTL